MKKKYLHIFGKTKNPLKSIESIAVFVLYESVCPPEIFSELS